MLQLKNEVQQKRYAAATNTYSHLRGRAHKLLALVSQLGQAGLWPSHGAGEVTPSTSVFIRGICRPSSEWVGARSRMPFKRPVMQWGQELCPSEMREPQSSRTSDEKRECRTRAGWFSSQATNGRKKSLQDRPRVFASKHLGEQSRSSPLPGMLAASCRRSSKSAQYHLRRCAATHSLQKRSRLEARKPIDPQRKAMLPDLPERARRQS